MNRLPVIVGFGGVNPAGRMSFDHAYRRLVIEALGEEDRARTYGSLAKLMKVGDDPALASTREWIDAHSLVRRIESFDPGAVFCQRKLSVTPDGERSMSFITSKRELPTVRPDGWEIESIDDDRVRVRIGAASEILIADGRQSRVSAAGQLPTGFKPGAVYPSRNHPRALEMSVYGASDALKSMGLERDSILGRLAPDEFAVYASTAMAQLDSDAYGGLLQNPLTGGRPTSKHVPFGLPDMPAAFVNAYVLGSVGQTAGVIGACATFLYNLERAVADIQRGDKRFVLVGSVETPVLPEVIEGYRVMGALAEDEELMALDGTDVVNPRRACRPFSSNCGFTVAESSAWVVVMDDALAMECGARVMASVGGVFVHADGYKKSISGPGVGNYLTVAKGLGLARALLGRERFARGTYVHAHGTGTPQNRVTESRILDRCAQVFGIERWRTCAIKSYVGHSMAAAGGDQLAAVLGAWSHRVLPGITTIDHVADDVYDENLDLLLEHTEIEDDQQQAVLVNAKGFGGNNATGVFLSPARTRAMLEQRHGKRAMLDWDRRAETAQTVAADYDERADTDSAPPLYHFGSNVISDDDLQFDAAAMDVPGVGRPLDLDVDDPYPDMH